MHSLTEKTQCMDKKLEHTSVVVVKYFEYIYVVLSHFEGGHWLNRAPNFVMFVMPELFSGYVINLRLSC